jgi:hypothetical protein
MDDLWPGDFDKIEAANAPVTILRQQAALLSQKMKNLIEGQVGIGTASSPPYQFSYSFYITCPSLNYHYEPFFLGHNVDLYPATLHLDSDIAAELSGPNYLVSLGVIGADIQTNSEDELKDILRKIFASQKVKKVIQALLGQLQTGYGHSPQA